ncbi:unnamed protein product [Allacma fusca]|uniref:DOMON domain-containing protein n=1 Tax=Allacma fusca TaxID=39272 RepID=A0A8J2KTN4_9HEXA|nr:unnamed protein product [Allacma fusca]
MKSLRNKGDKETSVRPSGATLQINRFQKLDDDYHVDGRADMTFENITFLITAKTLGYVGFGLSPQGGVEYADIVIGGVRHGKPYISDYHGEGNWKQVVDKSQDWQLRSATENGTHTTLEVSRVFNTCDNDDLPINLHQKRGSTSVSIINPVTPPINITECGK